MKLIGISAIGCMIIFSCAGRQPENLGAHNGRLTDCPSKPNCVSSQAAEREQKLIPFRYQGEKDAAFERLKKVILSSERTTIVKETDNYLHVAYKSKIMGFVDDVEFLFPKEKIIHLRSASRIGYSDFGANRRRVEHLRELFTKD